MTRWCTGCVTIPALPRALHCNPIQVGSVRGGGGGVGIRYTGPSTKTTQNTLLTDCKDSPQTLATAQEHAKGLCVE